MTGTSSTIQGDPFATMMLNALRSIFFAAAEDLQTAGPEECTTIVDGFADDIAAERPVIRQVRSGRSDSGARITRRRRASSTKPGIRHRKRVKAATRHDSPSALR